MEFDWQEVFGSMLDLGDPGAKDRSASAKLRDEIVEDPEHG
ncbi:YbaB/EbfC family DNA-binding protein OS=Streptomyces fumanus OX=67302 GN=GCM10018772_70960 PE=4 SV=1 [Streptomyces fumanus]